MPVDVFNTLKKFNTITKSEFMERGTVFILYIIKKLKDKKKGCLALVIYNSE